MEINLTYSKNTILKKYIHCYYASAMSKERYIAFPNYYFPTCIIENADFNYSQNLISVRKGSSEKLSFYGINMYKSALELQFEDNFQTFNIVFKPYGLAQFTGENFNFETTRLINLTSLLKPFFDEHPSFSSYELLKKIGTIECYLVSILSIRKHTEEVMKNLDEMVLNNVSSKSNANISNKTLYRAFKNICGLPPSTIFRTIRLRKAMLDIEQRSNDESLTEIAYSLDFFDQAHFSKNFKKSTQKSPKDFLNNITHLSDAYKNESIFFEFINNVR